jgi:hypothetical protein
VVPAAARGRNKGEMRVQRGRARLAPRARGQEGAAIMMITTITGKLQPERVERCDDVVDLAIRYSPKYLPT